jgi:hypothetical protein
MKKIFLVSFDVVLAKTEDSKPSEAEGKYVNVHFARITPTDKLSSGMKTPRTNHLPLVVLQRMLQPQHY